MPRRAKPSPIKISALGKLGRKTGSKIAEFLAKASAVRQAKANKMQRCQVKAVKGACPASHPYKGKTGALKNCCFGNPVTKAGSAAHRAHAGLKAHKVCLPKVDKRGITHEQVLISYPLKRGGRDTGKVATRCVKAGSRSARKFMASKVKAGMHEGHMHDACPSGKVAIQKTKVMLPAKAGAGKCCKNGAGPRTDKEKRAQAKRCPNPEDFITCPKRTYISCAKPRGEHKKLRALSCKVGEKLFSRMRTHTGGKFAGKTLKETRCMNPVTSRANMSSWKPVSGETYGTRAAIGVTHAVAAGHKGTGARKVRGKAGKLVTLKSGGKRLVGKGASRGKHALATLAHDRVHAAGSKAKLPAAVLKAIAANRAKVTTKKSSSKKKTSSKKKKTSKKTSTKAKATKKTAVTKAVAADKAKKASTKAKTAKKTATKAAKTAKAAKATAKRTRAPRAVVAQATNAVNVAQAAAQAGVQAAKQVQTAAKAVRKAKTPKAAAAASKRVTRASSKATAAANKAVTAVNKAVAANKKAKAVRTRRTGMGIKIAKHGGHKKRKGQHIVFSASP